MTQHDALRQERGVAKGERGAVEWCEVREEKLEDMVGYVVRSASREGSCLHDR